MDPQLNEWLNLIFRWFHVFAAILWIGTTAFFTWLDARMTVEKDPATGKENVWMVHSGGFYVVEKRGTPDLGAPLHWWKWEAAMTWLSGFLLLGIVYYMGGNLLDQQEPSMSVKAPTPRWPSCAATTEPTPPRPTTPTRMPLRAR